MERLIEIAHSLLKNSPLNKGDEIDLSEVKLFKVVKQDVDGDGQEEICFAAGINKNYHLDTTTCCLLDFQNEKEHIIELVPIGNGFRDLQILDINSDGIPEIVSLWQVGSGAVLSLYIFQWDGNTLNSLFPKSPKREFHQGFMEMKDLDADNIDEIVIWEGKWVEGAHWDSHYFDIYVFKYQKYAYQLHTIHTSEHRYNPSSIVSREISIMGTPPDVEHRFTPLENYKQQLETLIQNKQVDEDFVAQLGEHQTVLSEETFYKESLATIDLALEATKHLSDPIAKMRWSVLLWRDKGATLSLLGDYIQSVSCYLQALSLWNNKINIQVPAYYQATLHRGLGTMYLVLGDYEHALAELSKAQTLLEVVELSVPENRAELSRLHSNFGLTYTRLGEPELASAVFEQAIILDSELGNYFGLVINYMGLGNVQRTIKRYNDAIESYQAALAVMDEVFDRDRESDVYLELGSTLILNHQLEEGLQYLQKALLLTSVGNLKQREAIHYLYLGEAYRQLNELQLASQFFNKAVGFAQAFETPETQWQAFYGLALTYQHQHLQDKYQNALEKALNTIEQLRLQYLPENFKISLFAQKTKPYEAMVLLHSPTSPEQAFKYMEQIKSRVFIEMLATTTIGNAGISSEFAEQEVQLIGELRRLQLCHRETLRHQKYEWGDEIGKIETKLEQLWDDIRNTGDKGSEYIALRQATPLDFSGVKQILNIL